MNIRLLGSSPNKHAGGKAAKGAYKVLEVEYMVNPKLGRLISRNIQFLKWTSESFREEEGAAYLKEDSRLRINEADSMFSWNRYAQRILSTRGEFIDISTDR